MSNASLSNASLRIPSRRDQEIFHRVVVNCEPQNHIARELGLTKGRISQIISRVRRWLACGATSGGAGASPAHNSHSAGASPAHNSHSAGVSSASSPSGHNEAARHSAIRTPHSAFALDAAFSDLERQRLERSLAKARHEHLYELSLREINRQSQNPKHTTIRTEAKPIGDETDASSNPQSETCNSQFAVCNLKSQITKIVTTVRDQPLNVQLLKTAQRSAIELSRLADLESLPSREDEAPAEPQQAETQPAELTEVELFESLYSDLIKIRRQAEQQGRVAKSADIYSLVDHFLCAIAGQELNGGLQPDDAAREAVRRFLLGSLDHETWRGGLQILQDFAAELAPRSPEPNSSVPGSALGPHDPGYPLSGSSPANCAETATALNNTKSVPSDPNESSTHQAPSPLTPTLAPLTTSAPQSSSDTSAKPSHSPPQKNPQPLNPPPPGSWSFNVLDPIPYDHQKYDPMFHPWSRDF